MLRIKVLRLLAKGVSDDKKEPYGAVFGQLSTRYDGRYHLTKNLHDLDKAIAAARSCVELYPDAHPWKAGAWLNLSNRLRRRYDRTGNLDDLNDSIKCGIQAIAALPRNGDTRYQANCCSSLGNKLSRRYDRTLNMTDLEECIFFAKFAVELSDENGVWMDGSSLGFGGSRVSLSDSSSDESGVSSRDSFDIPGLLPAELQRSGDPALPLYLYNLATKVYIRYSRTGNQKYLNTAIRAVQISVSIATDDVHIHLPKRKSDLGKYLHERYRVTGHRKDLDRAIQYCRDAFTMVGSISAERMVIALALAERLEGLYEVTDQISDLNEAATVAQTAVDWTPVGHVQRANCLNSLGRILARQYRKTGEIEKLQDAAAILLEAWDSSNSLPMDYSRAASQLLPLLAEQKKYQEAAEIAKGVIDILPRFNNRSLDRADRQFVLSIFAGISASACSLLLEVDQPEQALHYLEKSRAVILGQSMDDRSDTRILYEKYPKIASKYERLRNEVNMHDLEIDYSAYVMDRFGQSGKRKRASDELEECIGEIRKLPKYKGFLLGQTAAEMRKTAGEGTIVVVNVTAHRSDAILISSASIKTIRLPQLTESDTKAWLAKRWNGTRSDRGKANRNYLLLFSWLWNACVKPVLHAMDTSEHRPRIWWLGSGLASNLPFHAAGNYIPHSTENAFHKTLSSYIPSIRALAHSRERLDTTGTTWNQVLIATMPQTPGLADLEGTLGEKEAIRQTTNVRLLPTTELDRPGAKTVLEALKTCNFAHFACHGYVDQGDPSESGLIFQKEESGSIKQDILTVQEISAVSLKNACIAYLSACSTAENKVILLSEEAIHVVTGFQVAGFGHVIGCLWPSVDRVCALVAGDFYATLFARGAEEWKANGGVANALREAVMKSWEKDLKQPLNWAQFVHYGA